MAKNIKSVKRTKTKYPNIYLNDSTGKYDIKYNYKEYSAELGKNVYKAKWIYNCVSIADAKTALANLQSGGVKEDNKDITLEGMLEFWEVQAKHAGFSPQTIFNTKQQLKYISKYLPLSTKVKDITETVYYKTFAELEQDYTGETVCVLESALRKLIQLAYKKEFITHNILQQIKRKETVMIKEPKTIPYNEFKKINEYLGNKESMHNGYNAFPRLQFLYATLYFTGIRLGECLALTWEDFQEFNYYPAQEQGKKENFHLMGMGTEKDKHLVGTKINVTKSILESGEIKIPKNKKARSIILPPELELLYNREHHKHVSNGGNDKDRVFKYAPTYCRTRLKNTCKLLGLSTDYNCHTFRHTYISNLINNNVPISAIEKASGDTQQTIFKRYSHIVEGEERIILQALANVVKQ